MSDEITEEELQAFLDDSDIDEEIIDDSGRGAAPLYDVNTLPANKTSSINEIPPTNNAEEVLEPNASDSDSSSSVKLLESKLLKVRQEAALLEMKLKAAEAQTQQKSSSQHKKQSQTTKSISSKGSSSNELTTEELLALASGRSLTPEPQNVDTPSVPLKRRRAAKEDDGSMCFAEALKKSPLPKAACIARSVAASKISGYKIKPGQSKTDKLLEQADKKKEHDDLFGNMSDDSAEEDLESGERRATEGANFFRSLKNHRKQHQMNMTQKQLSQLSTKRDKIHASLKGDIPSGEVRPVISENARPGWTCPFSHLRIVNPETDVIQFRLKMEERRHLKISKLKNFVGQREMQGDWVTIGTVVFKSLPKTSAKGTTYSILRLSDLSNSDNFVSLFLFGDVHKNLHSITLASVLAILNPTVMSDMEKKKDAELCLKVDNHLRVMRLGDSPDLAFCKSKTKNGDNCRNFINKEQGDFCTYHVAKAHKMASSKRNELQHSIGMIVPKKARPQRTKGGAVVNFEGTAISSEMIRSSVHRPRPLLPGSRTTTTESEELMDKINTGTNVGARCMQAFYGIKKKQEETASKPVVQVKPGDLLKQMQKHSNNIKDKGKSKGLTGLDVKNTTPRLAKGFSAGDFIDLSLPSTRAAKSTLRTKEAVLAGSIVIEKQNPNSIPGRHKTSSNSTEQARSLLQRQYSDTSSEPASKKSRLSNENQSPKLIANSLTKHSNIQKIEARQKSGSDGKDYNEILNRKSKHDHLAQQVEDSAEDSYFNRAEKKEAMEEKMSKIMEIERKAVSCKQCAYTAFTQSQRCKELRHAVTWSKAKQRFFICAHCKDRTTTLGHKYPQTSCKKCGGSSWKRTCYLKERKVVLENEKLELRGEETKFLNSLQ